MRCTLQQWDPPFWWRAPQHSTYAPRCKALTTGSGGITDARIVCLVGGVSCKKGLAVARHL